MSARLPAARRHPCPPPVVMVGAAHLPLDTRPGPWAGMRTNPLTRRMLRQKAFDGLLRRLLMLRLFPVFDERDIGRQRGQLS
jgi:hypothetical protein